MLLEKYEKLTSVKDGVIRLLTIRDREIPDFDVVPKSNGEYTSTLVLEGKSYPLLSWRYEPRMNRIHAYGKKVAENCCLNTSSFWGSDVTLDEVIYRELDIAEYALNSKIVKVTAFMSGAACNLIAKCESGAQANLELGATMAVGTIPQFQHRLITTHGMANDKGVNDLVEQNGVYLFLNDDPRARVYDDGEYYLYGLTVDESVECTFIQGLIRGDFDKDELITQDEHLRRLVAAVHESANSAKSVYVEV